MSYPERIIPDEESPGIVALHLKRYLFAAPYCVGKAVLDAACGVGYGSAELGRVASRVVGVDVDPETIAYARSRYGGANVEFETMDVSSLGIAHDSFDVVVSFETIEHVADAQTFLREITRVLKPDGTLVVSTPNAPRTTTTPDNPYHRVEFSRADFEALLSTHFGDVVLFGQRRVQTWRHRTLVRIDVLGLRRRIAFLRRAAPLVGTAPTEGVSLEGVIIERSDIERATELVAVCTHPR